MWTALRKIPVPLLAGELGMLIVATLGLLVNPRGYPNETALLMDGGQFASAVLATVGFAWLAPLVSGRARTGVRIAMYAAAAKVVCSAIWIATILFVLTSAHASPPETVIVLGPFTKMAGSIAVLGGLGVATRRWWIVAAAMLPVITSFVTWRVLYDPNYGISHVTWFPTLQTACSIASGIGLLAITIVASREAAPLDAPAPVARGLRVSAHALRAFVVATTLFVGAQIWISVASGHSPWFAYSIAKALQLACLCAFAAGALLAVRGRSELPSWVIVVGTALVLVVVSKLGMSLLTSVQLAIEPVDEHVHAVQLYPFSLLSLGSSGQMLVGLAFGTLLVAIAIGARRRGLEQLHTSVLVRTGVFTVLALGALTVPQLLGEQALDPGTAVLFFTSVAAALVALLVTASTVGRASRELGGEQYLPSAKLIRPAR